VTAICANDTFNAIEKLDAYFNLVNIYFYEDSFNPQLQK
jgi:hypothetical protein